MREARRPGAARPPRQPRGRVRREALRPKQGNHDENYGNIDASSMFEEEFDSSALIAAFKIEGAGLVLLVLCCILGCCGTCYSCCAIMSNCRLCPWYKKLYTTNNKQNYTFKSVATGKSISA